MLELRRRPPTAQELERFEFVRRHDSRSRLGRYLGCSWVAGVVLGAGGLLLEWLLGLASIDVAPYLRIGLPAVTLSIVPWWYRRGRRTAEPPDEVEEFVVRDAVFASRDGWDARFPIFVFQVEPERLLCLSGKWLRDSRFFYDHPTALDQFPCGDFTVVRDPRPRGLMLGVVPEARLADPVRTIERVPRLPLAGLLFDGTLATFEADAEALWRGTEEPPD